MLTSQETKPFDYCPFCGEALGTETFRFCPYCGGQLRGKVNKGKKKHKHGKKPEERLTDEALLETAETLETAESVETVEAAAFDSVTDTGAAKEPEPASDSGEEKTVANSNDSTASEAAAEPAAPKMPQEPQRSRPAESADDLAAVQTLILKYCPDKDKLLSKLQMILRRDRFAIKLAVEMTPAVLMYKSKAADLKPVMDACRELGAIYTVVSGDFSLNDAAPAALPESLSSEEQELIRKAPPALWLGENYHSFAGDITGDGEQGILALSEYHLLFLYREKGKIDLRLTPLPNICSAQIVNCLKNTGLSIRQQQKSKEVLYVSRQSEALVNLQQQLLKKIVPV